jgi:copper(I)-binding protein
MHSRCALTATSALLWVGFAINPVAAATPSIRADAAWVRWLPAGLPAGGYVTLTNTGARAVVLIAASSPDYAEVSVHRSAERAGNMEMRPVAKITIDPHSSLNFAATGYHLMFMQPNRSLKPGDEVPVTLHFADGSALTVAFAVRGADTREAD